MCCLFICEFEVQNFLRGPFEIQTMPRSKRVPRKYHRKVPVKGQLCLWTIGSYTYTNALKRIENVFPGFIGGEI